MTRTKCRLTASTHDDGLAIRGGNQPLPRLLAAITGSHKALAVLGSWSGRLVTLSLMITCYHMADLLPASNFPARLLCHSRGHAGGDDLGRDDEDRSLSRVRWPESSRVDRLCRLVPDGQPLSPGHPKHRTAKLSRAATKSSTVCSARPDRRHHRAGHLFAGRFKAIPGGWGATSSDGAGSRSARGMVGAAAGEA